MVNFGSNLVESAALVVELPMLAFHVSVTVFIAAKVRRMNEALDKVFYKLYLVFCASNYMRYFAIAVNRYELVPDGPFPYTLVSLWGFHTFYHFTLYFQLAAYSVIALNRWSALALPVRHRRTWPGVSIQYVTVGLISIALSAAIVLPTASAFYMWTANMDEIKAFVAAFEINGAIVISYDLLFTSVDVALEIWSFTAYRKLSFQGKRANVEDVRLLVFSMAEMVPQVLKVTYNIGSYAKIATPAIVYTAISFLVSFQALSAPLCLLAISPTLRREYKRFYGRSKKNSTPVVSLTMMSRS